MSIFVLNCEHHIFTASKISQNIWKLVLERILQKLMAYTDISSLFFLFSFKSIYSSLEEVCSEIGGKKNESFLWWTGALSSAQGILIQLVILSTIRSTSASFRMVLEMEDYLRSHMRLQKLSSTLQRHGVTLPMQDVLPHFLHGKQHLAIGLDSLQTTKCLL